MRDPDEVMYTFTASTRPAPGAGVPFTMGGRLPPGDPPDTGGAASSSSGPPPPPPPGGGAVFAEGWRGGRSSALDQLLSYARELRDLQRAQAEAAFPRVYRMDEDDDEIETTTRRPPPGPPPGGAGEVIQTHDMIRAQLNHVAAEVHELRNHAMVLEQRRMAEEHARAMEAEARRRANAEMFAAQHARGPLPLATRIADSSMEPRTKRESEEPPPVVKRQIVERVVEQLRPADAAAAASRRATQQIIAAASSAGPLPPVVYEPPKGEIMPYTHANPEVHKAVERVVASEKKRAEEPARKKTRYTTMARFTAAQMVRRREQRARERAVRQVAKLVVEDAAARAALKAPKAPKTPAPKAPKSPKAAPKTPKVKRDGGIVKMTPGRSSRAVAVE